MSIKLTAAGERTNLVIESRDDAKAKRDGMLPEPGKGRIVMANGHTKPIVISIGKSNYPLRAGQGTADPRQALNYSVAPGKYTLTIKIPGQALQTETVDITADTTWGAIVLPTGATLTNRLY